MIDIDKDWSLRMAHLEGDQEIGAGVLAMDQKPQPTEAQIKHMVERFLMWKLPDDFGPDGGISFERTINAGTGYEYTYAPVGTNLLTYTQAEAMVRHMLYGMPVAD